MKVNFQHYDHFQRRQIGPNEKDLAKMIKTIGVNSLEELIEETIPESIKLKEPLNIPEGIQEHQYLQLITGLAKKNKSFKSYIGLGFYDCITPSVIKRNIFENPGWYTQYTPYQAEIAQGRLEALLNFQTMVSDLTAMEIANASLLDEATGAAEAMTMLYRLRSREKISKNANIFLVSDTCYPQTISVLQSRAKPLGIELQIGKVVDFILSEQVFGTIIQYPAQDGAVYNYSDFIKSVHSNDALVAVAADLLSLTLLTPPGEYGADVVVGSTQRFGVPLGYGGPHAAYFATKEIYQRQIPGRIIGVSIDRYGNTAYRMALQTREQHIRREKATSNICTAQALLAIMAGMYAVYHGPEGLRAIAGRIHTLTRILEKELTKLGIKQLNQYYFDTIKLEVNDGDIEKVKTNALRNGINFRYINDSRIGISLDEQTETEDIQNIINTFALSLDKVKKQVDFQINRAYVELGYPEALQRKSNFLTHPVFYEHHSETKMMRYIKYLENRDLSLTTSMIPLGSCTMKLNPATAMIPISFPEISKIHPFVPVDQAKGYLEIIKDLEDSLCEITGLAACSLQPNSGAQGEYTGLSVIRAYHQDRGQCSNGRDKSRYREM